jgi:hypothetical protein
MSTVLNFTSNSFIESCVDKGEKDSSYAVAAALFEIAIALHRLGVADACTPMGALEALGLAIKDGSSEIADAISQMSNTVSKMELS